MVRQVKRREFINGALFATLAATSGCARDGGETRGGGNGATGHSLDASGTLCITVPGVREAVRFVAIDNSIYHVTERQLSFWRSEIAKGDPTVLLMHIPLWMEGFDIDTCANPNWGAATDRNWEIERREKWAERQSAESFALRSEVLKAPNLVAVLTGHVHRWLSASKDDRLMISAPHGKDGFACDVRIASAF